MQHGRDPQLDGETVLAEHQERLCGGRKQERVERLLVLLNQGVEQVWQREDQMEVWQRQQCCFLLTQPVSRGSSLAERAMPVAAGVRHEMCPPALLAQVAMPAQRGGATSHQRIENAPMMLGQGRWRALNARSQNSPQTWPSHRSRRPGTDHKTLAGFRSLLISCGRSGPVIGVGFGLAPGVPDARGGSWRLLPDWSDPAGAGQP